MIENAENSNESQKPEFGISDVISRVIGDLEYEVYSLNQSGCFKKAKSVQYVIDLIKSKKEHYL